MKLGKGPHEGRARNLGPSIRVVIGQDMLKQIDRLIAQAKKAGRRMTLSSAVRRLVDAGLAMKRERPVVPIGTVAREIAVRFDPETYALLDRLASAEMRDLYVVVHGFMALALREPASRERVVGTEPAAV